MPSLTVIVATAWITTGCITAPEPVLNGHKGYKPDESALTLMTYNVENLFDTEDDAGKQDEQYMPLAKKTEKIKATCRVNNRPGYRTDQCLSFDWSEEKLALKMKRLTDVLRRVRGGRGPDVLLMQEVENLNVLEIWRNKYLQDFNYKPAILIEGPDERGIDVAIFTRLEVVGAPKLHTLKFRSNKDLPKDRISETRGLLEATLKTPTGELITVISVHLPSQSNPSEMRYQALQAINKARAALPKDRMVIVGGDFNISSDEEVTKGFYGSFLSETWGVSQLIGCQGCEGTYYYNRNRSWSFFDAFLISKNMLADGNAPWQVVPESIRIENSSIYQTNRYGSPARFDENRKDGVSDHWPLAMDIIQRTANKKQDETPLKAAAQ